MEPSLPAFGPLLPSIGFARNGDAVVLYRTRPSEADDFTTVYAARRVVSGVWLPRQRLMADDGDTRFPRLTLASNGEALALFQYQDSAGSPFRVHASRYANGLWGAAQPLQPAGSPEGRFAVAEAYYSGGSTGSLDNLLVWWRETDPANPARMRIVGSVAGLMTP